MESVATLEVENPFVTYVTRLRRGDSSAVEELVTQYADFIRMEARMQMRGSQMNSESDSLDICQSVLRSFFLRAQRGDFSLDRPDDLRKLLIQMACYKSRAHWRKATADCRDIRKTSSLDPAKGDFVGNEPDPADEAMFNELLGRAEKILTPEERSIATLRKAGNSWAEISKIKEGNCHEGDKYRKKMKDARIRIIKILDLKE